MSEIGIKGFKVFNPDWTCMGKQYTCPGKFEENVTLSVCTKRMYFCKKAVNCFKHYSFDPENKVAEVIAYGDIAEEGDMCCTNKLEIVREIPWQELLEIVNTGRGNTGNRNSGNRNSGNSNSGDYNSGYRNSGNCNTGNCNTGNRNTGNSNSGNSNSGYFNSGDCNSGDWNKCSFSNGCFNTIEPKIYLFNKSSDWTYRDWINSEARNLLNRMPTPVQYIDFFDMTEEEKTEHPEAKITDGYLKELDNSENVKWWCELSTQNKSVIMSIPNFDKEIFKEITGIDVDTDH